MRLHRVFLHHAAHVRGVSGGSPQERESENAVTVPTPGELHGLNKELQRMLRSLLLYKSFFIGDWYRTLLHEENDPEIVSLLRRISEETASEARRALVHTREWDRVPGAEKGARRAAAVASERLVIDMIRLKEASTEAFLAAALCAPTDDVRRNFIGLADIDRQHVDELRHILGITLDAGKLEASESVEEPSPAVQVGEFPPGTVTRRLREALRGVQDQGHKPTRVIVSAIAFRHLRDEGSAPGPDGHFMGFPMDIDFGWSGECFSILTTDRLSCAEIVTQMHHARQQDAS